MAEGKRGRRTPEGRSAQSKVTQGVKNVNNVLHVNLDVRSGVPRATVVHPRKQQSQHHHHHHHHHQHQQQQQQQHQQQQKAQVLQGSCRAGVNGGIPVYIPSQKLHSHHNNNNNNNSNRYNYNTSLYTAKNYTKPNPHINVHTANSSTTSYRETLDEPPKYDDIFSTHVYHEYDEQQRQNKNYEKKPLKSYFLKHFPKVKTFSKLNSGNRSVNHSVNTFGSSSTFDGARDRGNDCYYTEIHIPPPGNHNNFEGVSHHSHSTIEVGDDTRQYPQVANQFCPQQTPDRKYTISLKPGHYKINVQWRSKTHPFRLTLTPSRPGEGEAPPPAEEQPLYYGSCEAHQQFVNQDVQTSLPRRLVHRLLFRHHSTPPLECSYNPEEEESLQDCQVTTDMKSQQPTCQLNHQQQCPQSTTEQTQQIAPHIQLQQQVAQQQHQLLQQHVSLNPSADRKGQKRCWEGGPRHRQRKSRYRWASLSCMHLSSLDESVGEASGCDSYGGYEGVEHLKRHSISHLKAVSAESLACGCQGKSASPAGRGFSRGLLGIDGGRGNSRNGNSINISTNNNDNGDGGGGGMRRRGNFLIGPGTFSAFSNTSSGVTTSDLIRHNTTGENILNETVDELDEREGLTDDSFVFIEKSQLKCHPILSNAARDECKRADVTIGEHTVTNVKLTPSVGERKTWHEDEAFIKQVVDEYFKDPVSLSDLEEKDSFEKTEILEKVKRTSSDSKVKRTASDTKLKRTASDTIGIAPKAEEEVYVSSSSSSSSSVESSESSSSSEGDHEFLENELQCASPSIDDTTYCESDDTTSWYTDDSLGYEADAEPSDKDTMGHVWRRWRSAPDVRQTGKDFRMRRMHQLGKLAGAAAAAAAAARKPGCCSNADAQNTKTSSPPWRDVARGGGGGGGGARCFNDGRFGCRGDEKKNTRILPSVSPYEPLSGFGYQPRKSCSVDETKLSRLKFGVKKVKKHKLLQFNHNDPGRSKPAQLITCNKRIFNNSKNIGSKCEKDITEEDALKFETSSRDLSLHEEDDFNGLEKLEFVNGKYKANLIEEKNCCKDVFSYECGKEIKNVDVSQRSGGGEENVVGVRGGSGCCTSVEGGSIDDSTAERTEKVLTQGLVIHHSNAKDNHHAILNASVIKNALSILREGITADLVEDPKAVPSTERGVVVPNVPLLTHKDDDKVCEEVNLNINREIPKAKIENSCPNDKDLRYKEECKGHFSEVTHFESENVNIVDCPEDLKEMNRTNITIKLTPPASNRKLSNVSVRRRSEDSLSEVKLPSNVLYCNKEASHLVEGGPYAFKKKTSSRSERTYENVDNQGRSPLNEFPSSSIRETHEGRKDSSININDVTLRQHGEQRLGKRSASVDSFRKRDVTSISRASTVSSSSETSSCCHARPKSKPKSVKCRVNSRSNDSTKCGQIESKEPSVTSSTSGQVFGNEYHVQRIQVGTGGSRKFAQTTQRSVIEVPVCGSEVGSNQGNTVQKSELVLEPSHSRGSTLKGSPCKDSQRPSFVTASFPKSSLEKTCISEYNIGDAQPRRSTPDAYGPLVDEFKKNRTQDKTNSGSSKHGKDAEVGKKSKKSSSKIKSRSTPIKYFSGILNAFGSAAPRFRCGLTNVQGNECEANKDHERRTKREVDRIYKKDNEKRSKGEEDQIYYKGHERRTKEEDNINYQREKEIEKRETGIIHKQGEIPHIVPLSVHSESEDSKIKVTQTTALLADGKGHSGDTRIGEYRGEESFVSPSAKIDLLQVRGTKNNHPAGTECPHPPVSDATVPPVPSPRPRRALRNNHESSSGNIAPTPPTRRKNIPEPSAKPLENGSSLNEDLVFSKGRGGRGGGEGGGGGVRERKHSRESTWHSLKTDSSSRRLAENFSHSGDKKRTRSQRSAPCLTPSEITTESSLSRETREVNSLPYENVSFHEKHSFGVKYHRRSGNLKSDSSNASNPLNSSNSQSDPKSSKKKSKDRDKRSSLSEKRKSIKSDVHRPSLHSQTNEVPSKSCASNNGSTASNTCSGGGGAGGGRGSGSQSYGGGSGEMEGNRSNSKEGVSGGGNGGWRSSGGAGGGGTGGMEGGYNPGGSGGESSGGTSGRRRRLRPPSLPTSPLQSSRPRRHSQTSQTSGGSLPSSPTRWRRPQFEDTWDGVCDEGGRDYRRLSRTPSAESVESESTSFYYSAIGSAVYDEPKSVYEDVSARYSFVTCPQYEMGEDQQAHSSLPPGAKTIGISTSVSNNIPRTISGDLNCDVDVSLSEGEIKVRVRTEDEEVTSSTPIHDGDSEDSDESDESEDECNSDESDSSHEYELSRSYKSRDVSPDVLYSTSETEEEDDDTDEDRGEAMVNEVKPIGTGIVHAVPCMAGTDSSNFSTLSNSSGRKMEKEKCVNEKCHPPNLSAGLRGSGLVHATPCWATTDSDVRSSVSSTDYFSKVCLSASTEEKIYEPQYENVCHTAQERGRTEEMNSPPSSEPDTPKRRLSGVWSTVEESEDEGSEWEDETLPANLRQSSSKASIGEEEEEEVSEQVRCPPEEDDDEEGVTHSYSILGENFRNNCVSPCPESLFAKKHQKNQNWGGSSVGEGFHGAPQPNAREGWDQREANAWEWHRAVWEHHKKIHEQHLQHIHQQQQHHQSLLSDVMSCLGGTKWGMNTSNWCHHSYPDAANCGRDEGRYPQGHECPTTDCRWSGQFHEDPPYQPAGATSPGDLGKPPPSPLPPSGSSRSRDTSSVPRDGARPQSRQRSRSRRRAHSANSKYRVELEIPPHVLTRQRPSSFSSLAARKPSSHSPEPLVDDLHQEALLYLADTSFDHTADANRRRLAERKKNEGNELYKAKDYREALKLYTQAIDLCPDCAAYYSNRSACYMMLGKYHDALNDAREAVRLDTTFVKGYLRVAKCNIALGDANAALSVLRQAGELEPTNRNVRDEMNNAQGLLRCIDEVHKATEKADYRTAIFHLDRALDQAVGCKSLKITKAEYLVCLQRFADAQEMVNEILQFDSGNADAIYVRGMCLYYQDNPEAAFNHFQHVLRLAPDHQKARDIYKKAKNLKLKKEEGNEAFKRGSFQEAFNLYTDALAIDPLNKNTNAKLYFNRATVGSKLNKLEEAIEDCTAAINLDEGYVKAYLRRAKCYQTLEKHEEAVRDYEKVTRLDRNQEHKRLLHEAKIQLKRSKRKDYYKILGVGKTASEDEIKKSYRKMALVHHPDRHANASDKDKREHEIKFKEIGEAYSVLTDSEKRTKYDRGQDINDPDGGFGHEADIDPNQIFQAFFGNHGGHGFGAHASFQQGGFPGGGFSGGSFPGGFHFQFG